MSGAPARDVQQKGTVRCAVTARPACRIPRRRPRLRSGGSQPRLRAGEEVRALALRHALSAKAKDGGLIVIDTATLKDAKTKSLVGHFRAWV